MKDIQKEVFEKVVQKARGKFLLTYFGHSNNMAVASEWNGKRIDDPHSLTDEQLVLLWQLVNHVQMMLVNEQARRDLLPEEIKKGCMRESSIDIPILNKTKTDYS